MGVANGALGLARCFFPGVPVIPAGARQAAFAAVASVSASSAAPFGGRVQAAGSRQRRTAAAAGAKGACAVRRCASSRAFWRRARRGQGVWGPAPRRAEPRRRCGRGRVGAARGRRAAINAACTAKAEARDYQEQLAAVEARAAAAEEQLEVLRAQPLSGGPLARPARPLWRRARSRPVL
jgi:hypothetical protein